MEPTTLKILFKHQTLFVFSKYIKYLFSLENTAFAVICFISVFAYSNNMNDMYITPKWLYVDLFAAMSAILICTKFLIGYSLKLNTLFSTNVICIICIIEATYGIFQYFSTAQYEHALISGSFDNPAGFASCLCIGLPFLLWHANKSINRWFYIIGIFIVLFAILISLSRTGIITAFATLLIIGLHNLQKDKFIKFLVFIFIIIAIITFCYFLKKDSADGRLLIWRCSIDMFLDKPFGGHGINSFRKYYMYYQADYFDRNPNSPLQQLADTIQIPFNEYIRILVDFGIIGFSMIILFIYILIKRYNKNLFMYYLSIISIAIFSLASYPFSYPFTWIIFIFSFFKILPNLHFETEILKIIAILILITAPIISYKTIIQISTEREWHKADLTNDLPLYDIFNKTIHDNPYFLYNFAIKLYNSNQLERSLSIALECRSFFADYDLEFLLADIYMKQHNYNTAIEKYILCSKMCPCRFLPYSQLLQLYIKIGDNSSAYKTATIINEKPIKIATPLVKAIKLQAKNYLRTHRKSTIINN